MAFRLTQTDTFWSQLRGLPDARLKSQLIAAIEELEIDPRPDGDRKKKLKNTRDNLYRLKVGDYRIWYRFGDGWVDLLRIELRNDAYRGLDRVTVNEVVLPAETPELAQSSSRHSASDPELPRAIDLDLLRGLHVPPTYHQTLLRCRTLDDLCRADVPEDILNWVFDCVTEEPIERVLEDKRRVIESTADLLRGVEGQFVSFLLRLDAEQERVVNAITRQGGPALVTGGPGSGKSVVALYTARSAVRALREAGAVRPRVLFTTYTNALVKSSQQQLRAILGGDARSVNVWTADKLAQTIVESIDGRVEIVGDRDAEELLQEARRHAFKLGAGNQEYRALPQSIASLSGEFLLTEIGSVIEALQLQSLNDYLAIGERRRAASLSPVQRRAIWLLSDPFRQLLAGARCMTWSQMRRRALEIVQSGGWSQRFDAVIVDEAQDLEASALRLLVSVCATPERLLVTADTNQSIYRTWTDIHRDLDFGERVWLLHTSHRTTREIMDAARFYVADGALDERNASTEFTKSGQRPFVRTVSSAEAEAELLATFFGWATRQHKVGYGACAVLVPSNRAGNVLVSRLAKNGIKASYTRGTDLDLSSPAVKVLTLHAAKGLEFSAVALAGFFDGRLGPARRNGMEDEDLAQHHRRLLFVGMTRAMRSLMIIRPAHNLSAVPNGFVGLLWDSRDWEPRA